MPPSVGVPVRLFHECVGFSVSIELLSGEIYRGKLKSCEENLNSFLTDVLHFSPNGNEEKMDFVFLRGSKIRLIILPEMMKNSPIIKKFHPMAKKAASDKSSITHQMVTAGAISQAEAKGKRHASFTAAAQRGKGKY